jgi:hypothetical protein
MNEALYMTTAQAADRLGWPRNAFSDIQQNLPGCAINSNAKSPLGNRPRWPVEFVEKLAILSGLGFKHLPAARVAIVAKLEGGRLIIDPAKD